MDATRVDQILQFALARAAQEDDWQARELGPIHLIKYVYLADLAYAARHNGETFTGAPWIFFHYGPWSAPVFERLKVAADTVGAETHVRQSKYDKDFTRYALSADDAEAVERAVDRQLPTEVASAVKNAVHKFGTDTSALLDWVYRTPPMLRAAPNDSLDFSVAVRESTPSRESAPPAPSRRQEKKLDEALEAARNGFRQRMAMLKQAAPAPPKSPPPRYDEVFAQGSAWLDAEGNVEPLQGEVRFPDDIWKSDWRNPNGGE